MSNPSNTGTLTGRLSQDKQIFKNAKGTTILATLAVEDNYLSGQGKDRKAQTQFIPVRIYVPETVSGLGSWDRVHKGDLIQVQTRIACTPYQKNGETVFPEPTVEIDGYPVFLESKQTVDARAARKAVAAAPAPAAAPAEETPEETIARLQAQLDEVNGTPAADYADTMPFAGASA